MPTSEAPVNIRAASAPRDLLGQSLTWLCGGALALNLLLILGLLALIAVQGLGFFWQKDLLLFTLADGTRLFAEIHEREVRPAAAGGPRLRLKTGNRDLTGLDFRWVEESAIAARERPRDAVLLERLEWGNFHGRAVELRRDGEVRAQGAAVWEAFGPVHAAGMRLRRQVERLEKADIGAVNTEIERLRLERRGIEMGGADPARHAPGWRRLPRGRRPPRSASRSWRTSSPPSGAPWSATSWSWRPPTASGARWRPVRS